MNKTSIEWTSTVNRDGTICQGFTANPIRARDLSTGGRGHYCELLSPGCAHCYASGWQKRFKMPPFPGKSRVPKLPLINKQGNVPINERLELYLDEAVLLKLIRRKKPAKIFLGDMTDIFGSWVPDLWLDQIFAAVALSNQTVQVLTKRADRMAAYFSTADRETRIYDAMEKLAEASGIDDFLFDCWPLPNLWLGVSVEDRKHGLPRIEHLRNTPAAVRFLSIEPLLEDIGDIDLAGIQWTIVGGESGPRARPCHPDWVRSIRNQCRAAAVPFFFKQGSQANWPHFKTFDSFPADLQFREFPEPHHAIR